MRFRCDNKLALQSAFEQIAATFGKTGFADITVTGKRRTLDQNAILAVWVREIAEHLDDGTSEEDVRSTIKLLKGFSMLRAIDDVTDAILRVTIDPLMEMPGGWEQALHIASGIPCTSKLPAEQMSKLLEFVQLHYWGAMQIRLEAK